MPFEKELLVASVLSDASVELTPGGSSFNTARGVAEMLGKDSDHKIYFLGAIGESDQRGRCIR